MSKRPPEHIALLIPRLGLTGTERVLELGGAPGVAAGEIGRILTGDGHLTVVDRSATGVRRTVERNQQLVDAGRLSVVRKDLTTIEPGTPGFETGDFDVIFASNVNVFWTHPGRANVASLAALLKPGGRLHLFYGYATQASPGDGRRVAEQIADTLKDALTAVEVHGASASITEITEITARR